MCNGSSRRRLKREKYIFEKKKEKKKDQPSLSIRYFIAVGIPVLPEPVWGQDQLLPLALPKLKICK